MSFECIKFDPILKAGLAARCVLRMPSGIQLTCNIVRRKTDPNEFIVMPVSERLRGGGYGDLVTFATDTVRDRWSEMAFAAIEDKLPQLHTDRVDRSDADYEACDF